MGPDVLHAVHIAHEGLGEIRQIPLAEVAQRARLRRSARLRRVVLTSL